MVHGEIGGSWGFGACLAEGNLAVFVVRGPQRSGWSSGFLFGNWWLDKN